LLAGENVRHDFIIPTVAAAIDLVVHCQLDAKTGNRRVFEIVSLKATDDGTGINVADIFTRKRDDLLDVSLLSGSDSHE
jgi:pilus assembly protein CpaF